MNSSQEDNDRIGKKILHFLGEDSNIKKKESIQGKCQYECKTKNNSKNFEKKNGHIASFR